MASRDEQAERIWVLYTGALLYFGFIACRFGILIIWELAMDFPYCGDPDLTTSINTQVIRLITEGGHVFHCVQSIKCRVTDDY